MRTCTHTKKRRRQTWRYLGTNYRLTEADRKIPESLMILSPPPPFLNSCPLYFSGFVLFICPGRQVMQYVAFLPRPRWETAYMCVHACESACDVSNASPGPQGIRL